VIKSTALSGSHEPRKMTSKTIKHRQISGILNLWNPCL